MKRQEYLDKLELELRRQNIVKVDDVLADYKEHFEMALAKGKTEEEIVAKLGDPITITKAYQAENLIQKIQDAPVQDQFSYFIRAVLRLIILTPINFFMLIGPILLVFIMITTLWSLVLALGGAAVGVAIKAFALLPLSTLGFWGTSAALMGTISGVSSCLLGILIMFFITRFILQIFIRYLQWNVEFVKGTAQ